MTLYYVETNGEPGLLLRLPYQLEGEAALEYLKLYAVVALKRTRLELESD